MSGLTLRNWLPSLLAFAMVYSFSGRVYSQQVVAFLDRYCVDCHNADGPTAGFAFDEYRSNSDLIGSGRKLFRILDVVETGVMPPADAESPTLQERTEFYDTALEQLLSDDDVFESHTSAVVMRRMNRNEYNNTLRDLLGLDLHLADDFPSDDIGFGYDNVGSALNMSPVHVERYLSAAESAMQAAITIPDAESLPPVELIGLRTYPLPPGGTVEFEHHLKPGRYLVDFSLVRVGINENAPTPLLDMGLGREHRKVHALRIQDETVLYRVFLRVTEGDASATVSVAVDTMADVALSDAEVGNNVSGDQRYGNDRGLHVDSMVVRGPLPDIVPQPRLSKPILTCDPDSSDQSAVACARQIVKHFARAAFRRPVSEDETERLIAVFGQAYQQGESFEGAVRLMLTAVLVSPQFLYLVEPDATEGDRLLTEFELASRLSYFLWSSMPDDNLLKAAEDGTLRRDLRQHVQRLLDDPKSQAFIENFGGQWLLLRNLESASPDSELFPQFDLQLKQAMRQETELCLAYVLRQNRSVLELLNSDYTFLNETLAEHYEMENVIGPEFRRVEVSDGVRGGIITQASVLTLTSHHNRTSPVKRGQWILQQLLGTPPPPPPPDVAQLDDSPQAAATASLRERLEIHRSSPECASCHSQMDPLGFGLENFDAIGRWRTMDGEFEIDPSGVLPGRREFDDVRGLKTILAQSSSRKFCWCLIENMLTYALGRPLNPNDYRLIEQTRQRLVANDYRVQEILFAIVESDAFQRRGVAELR